ncbi:hypothetical protein Heshes_26750 [Alicyclobacillus hesperidum]|uniref:Uncharacterized protein n=1 Tax=Alicyclobacillus hesperidum TaxID=89784 RepID=A0AA37U748_9BACL|nr:hypothetical protein Heshes_26750 [Alicyclobacillus hesperidum]
MIDDHFSIEDDDDGDGVWAVPRDPAHEPRVKVRALWDYCQSRGVKPSDLSEEEMRRFLVWDMENRCD